MNKFIVGNDDGTEVYACGSTGLLIGQHNHHRHIQRMIDYDFLYNISQCAGREAVNFVVMENIKDINSQFFEEV